MTQGLSSHSLVRWCRINPRHPPCLPFQEIFLVPWLMRDRARNTSAMPGTCRGRAGHGQRVPATAGAEPRALPGTPLHRPRSLPHHPGYLPHRPRSLPHAPRAHPETPRHFPAHAALHERWDGAAAPAPGTRSQRGTKGAEAARPKDKNSNEFSAKEQSHSNFPGIQRKGFRSWETREKAITAFQTVLQEEDKSAYSFK